MTNDTDPQTRGDVVVTGTRDEASEGTGDYATATSRTATRLGLSQKDTPQSISVVTRTQIDDFRLTDVNTLLQTTTGVNVQAVETDRSYYSARGFEISNFQLDGIGLPFAFNVQSGALDTATYDRVEVLRGANGLLSSTGNPSATINFVRKRPGTQFAGSASALYGSFDQKRIDGDLTVPVTANGRVRARLVGAYLDSDGYLDRYSVKRSILYGITEADLGANTTVAVGYQRQDHRTRGGLWGALPLYYTDGSPTNYARSTSTSADWTRWNVLDQQIFGDVTHDFGNGWNGKISVMRRAIDEDEELFYVYGAPDRTTGLGLFSYVGAFNGPTRELTTDAYLSGPLTVFGRKHDVVFGVNRGVSLLKQYSSYPAGTGISLSGNTAFEGQFPKPSFGPFTLSADTKNVRESVYGLIRLNPADALKVMVGGNVTRAVARGVSYGVANSFERTRVLPFAGATLALSQQVNAYVSYATIFNPQRELDANFRTLDPIEGDNIEAGVKGEWFAGRLNASASVFRARQNNTAESLRFDTVSGQQLYTTIDAKSEGVEFDVGGQVLPGLQLTGGYTALRIRNPAGASVRTYVPRNTGRLNAVWTPEALPALKLGAALQYQSRITRDQQSTTPAGAPIFTTQGAYATVDAMARYDFSDAVSVTANVRNITNAKYLTSLFWAQSFYGAPRAGTVTLGLKF
ncbi:TonB-dependent siderophore receptor [Sphingomonas floccifaciens]|uniref:TonB-dependent siderophore receptor n=1 Tax=Sphingomonas floccifaciens TaxID=1844115 RepID=A0ABW4NAB3_9SPHN